MLHVKEEMRKVEEWECIGDALVEFGRKARVFEPSDPCCPLSSPYTLLGHLAERCVGPSRKQ